MKKRIFKVITILSAMIFVLHLYYFLNINYGFGIPCLFHEIFGLYCPGCGITHCLFSILEGNIYRAFKYNQLVFILLPFIGLYFIYEIYLYIFNRKDKIINKIPNKLYIFLLIITIIFGIMRNINVFTFLQP